jgi:hypothetical protein
VTDPVRLWCFFVLKLRIFLDFYLLAMTITNGFSCFSGLLLMLTIVGFQGRLMGGSFMEGLGFMESGGDLSSVLQLPMLPRTSTLLNRYLSNVLHLS